MSCRFALPIAIAAVALSCVPLHAEPFKPLQARKVDLGTLSGVAYYTVEPDGDRLVLTLRAPDSATPFRFVATLAPGQAVTLSVPRAVGEPALDVHFARRDGLMWMNDGTALAHTD